MPRVCTVCSHGSRPAIDEALVASEPLRTIADRFGVSKTALIRHKASCLPASLVKAQEAEAVADADDLLGQVRGLQARALGILDKAEKAGDLRTALGAIREARGNLELLAKLLGELDERPTFSLVLSPEWIRVRSAMLEVLFAFPEARVAVASRLLALESGNARTD